MGSDGGLRFANPALRTYAPTLAPGPAIIRLDQRIVVAHQALRRALDHLAAAGVDHHPVALAQRHLVADAAHELLRRGEVGLRAGDEERVDLCFGAKLVE